MVPPEIVVVGMRDEIVPRRNRTVEIFRVCIRKNPEAEIELVGIEAVERKTVIFVGGFEQRRVLERIAEPKRAIVKEIVAEENVTHAGLLGNRFQRGMWVDHAHGDEKAIVGNTVEADAAVV